ncbi:MAG: aminomethyl-transferring glycine dehydrogenase [Actinomycetaceae bacterium]|nr:aminomethyl-transferring glycine dehydrogenase [Actinomycetaceae bacterium]
MVGFVERHVGTLGEDRKTMLRVIGAESIDDLLSEAIPLELAEVSGLPEPASEEEVNAQLARIAASNTVRTSMIGQGFYDTVVPAAILRNIFENPSWYTAYTPYQPEISQGRLEALVNFQTMVCDLTGMEVAGASLLDESSAAAEAVMLAVRGAKKSTRVAVDRDVFEQTKAVIETRAKATGIEIVPVDVTQDLDLTGCAGLVVQYPAASGAVLDVKDGERLARAIHDEGGALIVIADLLACAMLVPPGEFGADIVAGSAQRLGQPMGAGGPHAGYIASTEKRQRHLPGRLVGVSRDAEGNPAYRLALQTREQHIRREKATSNICTAQSLLAIMASMYAVYHGPEGLRAIADRVHGHAKAIAKGLGAAGIVAARSPFFDTLNIELPGAAKAASSALLEANITSFVADDDTLRLSCDELTDEATVTAVINAITSTSGAAAGTVEFADLPEASLRTSDFLTHETFHSYRTETQLMRYMRELAAKDYALDRGMIPLGSCTMKLNSAAEMLAVSLPGFARIHPFAPESDLAGYRELIADLTSWLTSITGYDAVSVQPNAGSQGEFAGLLAIRSYHLSRGQAERDVCLIPASAHGTNAASAVLAGFKVVVVATAQDGSTDMDSLKACIAKHEGRIGALMITYPSTHGTFEPNVREVTDAVHAAGGQVYIDGANLNAMVGYARPGDVGGDVSHLNLHKTFAIPHGGGGPGVGPVCVKEHLADFLPGETNQVAAAPWGSASILPITWAYIRLLGLEGLKAATAGAILAANYVADRLEPTIPVLYRGPGNHVGHECILDTRVLKEYGISVDDVAKRLIDYGFHAPTMSFPVAGTLMVEPTESEDLGEVERFCQAIESIVAEAKAVGEGVWPADDNPLVNAPHTAECLIADDWQHPYSREQAAYPGAAAARRAGADPRLVRRLIDSKYWSPVRRIDGPWGDRNFVCTCPPLDAYDA